MQKEREKQKLKEICSECGRAKHDLREDSSTELISESESCRCIEQSATAPEIHTKAADLVQVASPAAGDNTDASLTVAQKNAGQSAFWHLGWKISLGIGLFIAMILTLILLGDPITDPGVKFGHIVIGLFAFSYEFYLLYSAFALVKFTRRFARQQAKPVSVGDRITRFMLLATMPGIFIVLAINAFLDFANLTGVIPLDSEHLWLLILGNKVEVVVMSFVASLTIGIVIMAMIHRAAEDSNRIKKID